ncbi:ankyrin [Neocallimastix californiae]|uniref:Ankyrin n=1 Tax=Neocallimastix californiae TaxID=1754190 RepID=A0A1Y2DCV0_9FUNG|nr:ankyrin [Neocallimastix californiae]|eukprot:ORY57088.1 ankyrin [Neocallimastix californiae]
MVDYCYNISDSKVMEKAIELKNYIFVEKMLNYRIFNDDVIQIFYLKGAIKNNTIDMPMIMLLYNYLMKHSYGLEKIPKNNKLGRLLNMAIENNNYELIQILLENKEYASCININDKDSYSEYPIVVALNQGNIKIIDYLLCHGADLSIPYADFEKIMKDRNKRKITEVLSKAIKDNNITFIKYLMENNRINPYLGVSDRDYNSDYPVMLALEKNNLEIFNYLLDHGAELKTACNDKEDYKNAFVTILNQCIEKNDFTRIKYLFENDNTGPYFKMKLNTKGRDGQYPITLALFKGNIELIDYLFQQGAEISILYEDKNNYKTEFVETRYEYHYNNSMNVIDYDCLTNEDIYNLEFVPHVSSWSQRSSHTEKVYNKNNITHLYNLAKKTNKKDLVKYMLENEKIKPYINNNNINNNNQKGKMANKSKKNKNKNKNNNNNNNNNQKGKMANKSKKNKNKNKNNNNNNNNNKKNNNK